MIEEALNTNSIGETGCNILDVRLIMKQILPITFNFDFNLATLLVPIGRLPVRKQIFGDSHTSSPKFDKTS